MKCAAKCLPLQRAIRRQAGMRRRYHEAGEAEKAAMKRYAPARRIKRNYSPALSLDLAQCYRFIFRWRYSGGWCSRRRRDVQYGSASSQSRRRKQRKRRRFERAPASAVAVGSVAGEGSGESHAAKVVARCLRQFMMVLRAARTPDIEITAPPRCILFPAQPAQKPAASALLKRRLSLQATPTGRASNTASPLTRRWVLTVYQPMLMPAPSFLPTPQTPSRP